MAMSATGNRSHAPGSTLIELLVGLVIVSVVLGATMLAFPRTGERRADQAATQAQALVELACERAELTGEDIGIAVDGHDLVFSLYRDDAWKPFADSPREALRRRKLDPAVTLELRIDQPMLAPAAAGAQVLCLASGESTPFVLDLRGPAQQQRSLRGDGSGVVRQGDDDAR